MSKTKSKTKSKTNLQTDQDLPVIAGFWVGPYLSWIEQMGLLSFVKHGHKVVLYTYGEVKNVPDGIEVRPAQEICDREMTAYHVRHWPPSSLAINADNFKWHLQCQTDYIYADADVFCRQPIEIFSRQNFSKRGAIFYKSRFFRMPDNIQAIERALRHVEQKFPVPDWYPLKAQKKLRRRISKGRGRSLGEMDWSLYGDHLLWPLLSGVNYYNAERFCKTLLTDFDIRNLLYLSAEDFERCFLSEHHLAVFFHKALLYSQLGDDFKNVPEQSWLGRKAAELGIDPEAAPLIKTRRQNDLYAKAYLPRLMR